MKPTRMLKYREWKKAKYLKLKDTKVSQSNRNTRTRCKLFSKLTIKIPERRSGVFIVNFEHISHILVFLLLTLNTQFPVGIILAFNKMTNCLTWPINHSYEHSISTIFYYILSGSKKAQLSVWFTSQRKSLYFFRDYFIASTQKEVLV